MKEMIRFGFILSCICVVAAGLLAGVNALTREKILQQAHAEETASLREVMPQALSFEAVEDAGQVLYYRAVAADGKVIGAAFKSLAKGYASTIETMVGLSREGQITAIKVISQNETPGLGSQVAEPAFTQRFRAKSLQDISKIQAITGATVSSAAVIRAVEEDARKIMELLKNG
jgi:Na+-translocating ferredoxin:NAD+ oxidoreductase subunit G